MSLVSFTGGSSRLNHRDMDRSFGTGFSGTRGGSSWGSDLMDTSDFFGSSKAMAKMGRHQSKGDDFGGGLSQSSRGLFGQMDSLMGSMMRDPFGGDPFFRGGMSPFPSIMGPPQHQQQLQQHHQQQQQQHQQQIAHAAPRRDQFASALSPFGPLMSSMQESMSREGSCHSFSSSSVMTMSTGPDGRPQAPLVMQRSDANACRWKENASRAMEMYQASSSTRGAPGGVRETHRSMADSRTGQRKMAIGHHIEDRSHVIEKEVDRQGEMEERQEFVNLDEGEAQDFDVEFQRRSQGASLPALDQRRPRFQSSSSPVPAIHQRSTYSNALPATASSYRRRARPMLALTNGTTTGVHGSSEERGPRHRDRGAGRNRASHDSGYPHH